MPKPFPIYIEVEEIAVGTVLRRLHEMAGVITIDLKMGLGGTKPLPHANGTVPNELSSAIVGLLMSQGPKSTTEIIAATGAIKKKVYAAVHYLKKKKFIKAAGMGRYRITDSVAAELKQHDQPVEPIAALPPPPAKRTPTGRAAPGSGNAAVRAALHGGPLTGPDLRAKLSSAGISQNSTSGVIDRAKRDGLIKRNGKGYELTAKGHKIELTEVAHG